MKFLLILSILILILLISYFANQKLDTLTITNGSTVIKKLNDNIETISIDYDDKKKWNYFKFEMNFDYGIREINFNNFSDHKFTIWINSPKWFEYDYESDHVLNHQFLKKIPENEYQKINLALIKNSSEYFYYKINSINNPLNGYYAYHKSRKFMASVGFDTYHEIHWELHNIKIRVVIHNRDGLKEIDFAKIFNLTNSIIKKNFIFIEGH